jgi:hypothetical protein
LKDEAEIESLEEQASYLSSLIEETTSFQESCRTVQDRAKALDQAAGLIINSVTWMLKDLVAIQRSGAKLLQDDTNRAGLAAAVFEFLENTGKERLLAGDKRLQQIGARIINVVSERERHSSWAIIMRKLW